MCVHVCLFFSEEPRQWSEAFHILIKALVPRFFSCQKVTPRFRCEIHIASAKQEDKNRTEGNHFCMLLRILLRSVFRWSVRTCIAERASWVRQQLYRYRITDASFWKWQAHKDVYYMVFISFKNSECTKILKSRYRSSSVEHWRRQHGHKKVKTHWYFSLCDTVRHGWKPWKLFACMCISWQWSCGGARFKWMACGL